MNEPRQKLSETVKDLLSQGHSVELSAYGRSMIPFLRPGQKVKLTPTELSQIVRGDLVAFHKQDYLVVHRVYAVLSTNGTIQLLTKGDSTSNHDHVFPNPKFKLGIKKSWFSISSRNFIFHNYHPFF